MKALLGPGFPIFFVIAASFGHRLDKAGVNVKTRQYPDLNSPKGIGRDQIIVSFCWIGKNGKTKVF